MTGKTTQKFTTEAGTEFTTKQLKVRDFNEIQKYVQNEDQSKILQYFADNVLKTWSLKGTPSFEAFLDLDLEDAFEMVTIWMEWVGGTDGPLGRSLRNVKS